MLEAIPHMPKVEGYKLARFAFLNLLAVAVVHNLEKACQKAFRNGRVEIGIFNLAVNFGKYALHQFLDFGCHYVRDVLHKGAVMNGIALEYD